MPAGVTIEQVAAEFAALMARHPALRMRLGAGDGGGPCQVVSAGGETVLDVVDVPDDADPADVAAFAYDLGHARLLSHYDLYRDWSVRMAVIRHRGALVHRVLTIDHLVVDGTATSLILADLGRPAGGPPGRRPAYRADPRPGPAGGDAAAAPAQRPGRTPLGRTSAGRPAADVR
ncbi:condensation domain-containing protein [Micromonospora sp. BRA006-A]|nr:condensation domain-containing protein [Micromonospora sp. BRA006-A]